MRKLFALAISAGLALTGCTASRQETEKTQPTVFAAASLGKVLPEIEPNASYSFDGSSGLVDQLAGGARADVFLSADERNMNKAVEKGLVEKPTMFATNYLVLVTPGGNPAGITGLDDSLTGKKLVVCAPEVPCGAASLKLAERRGVTLKPISEESKVSDVVGKVSSGEADAGLVYATDAAAAKNVETIPVPGAEENPNTYWAAVVKGAGQPETAAQFIKKLTQEEGLAKLKAAGFGPPR
ncbi:molybdate ABC transporter substrate-binding protein [Tessaracoccus sp. OH4464_COT-324]|uniref:molybdate ABC transporter substrate-binding protein n=1 Tax=Tessaracoccus sp. OH4464_COT-324 TaxID=2491059 RepID=UPI000F631E57|nr:molybdate ABC transporter substrate-binding protein [Tessaracoccus sp. OH4464_COT-324]RRD46635.1 molybdate ABC transporter substrate-binding protein [Tessaracoccus sp. OH4464_COT-324]